MADTDPTLIAESVCSDVLEELAQAVHPEDYSEVVWQVLICAYCGHPGWRSLAESVFYAHGYTPDEIRQHNALTALLRDSGTSHPGRDGSTEG